MMDGELNTKSMMTTLRRVVVVGGWGACRWGWGLRGLQGRRKCLLYEQLVKVLISGVFPRAASLNVAAALKLLIINSPKGPKLILYSHKALMQGKVGANGTLEKQTSKGGRQRREGGGEQPDADAVMDRTDRGGTHRQTDTGEEEEEEGRG